MCNALLKEMGGGVRKKKEKSKDKNKMSTLT
jgi:hypothetical protein